jgi:hypothetical protein
MLAGDNWSLPQVTSQISHVRHWLFLENHMWCALLNVTKLRLQLLLQWSVEKQNLRWWKSFNLRWWALYFQWVTPETLSEKSCQCRNAQIFHLSGLSFEWAQSWAIKGKNHGESWHACLMKFQVVIKRDEGTELGRSEPCESVTADGQEDESHI